MRSGWLASSAAQWEHRPRHDRTLRQGWDMISLSKALRHPWAWKMAWRDTRRSRRGLLLYSMSIVLGVAALVAVGSFGENLQDSIESQAKTLLGADLAIASNSGFSEQERAFLDSLGGVQAREVSFSSMVYFPRTGSTRLAQIRALEGDFPFYGTLETSPENGLSEFRKRSGALAEESLMKQFGLTVGDSVKIGELLLPICGSLQRVPGEMGTFSTFAPRVYIPLEYVARTDLLQKGSLVRQRVYFKFDENVKVTRLLAKIRPMLEKFHLDVDTVERRKRSLGRAMTNLYHFLNLVGFVALLLGGIGIASAVHVHVKQKLPTVAILRSLGCTSSQAFAIYLVQGIGLGLIGVVAGAGLGLAVQISLPAVLADFIPFRLSRSVSWMALAKGAALGFVVCLLFALLPLLSVRRVPPLAVLRSSVEHPGRRRYDPLLWAVYALLGGGFVAFSISQSQHWKFGLGFAAGVAIAFALLTGLAQIIILFLKRFVTRVRPFTWRQGLASLYRPNNRTVLLMLSLGLGTFLILTLYLLQANLVAQILPNAQEHRPDAVLFDVQPDQKEGVTQLLHSQQLPLLQDVPVVTMRLSQIKGRSVDRMRKDPRRTIPNWALRREYRSTYRAELVDSEELLAGTWHERIPPATSPIPVSIEEGIAKTLEVSLGDQLVFDVQGVPVETVIANVREVDWRRLQPNFFFVFPLGALEEAPSFHVLVTHVGTSEKSGQMQRALVQQFPNVSTVDLTLVLQTLDTILRRISFVVRFMALFTVGTGLIVLVASLLSGRGQRIQESILLRTLGASRKQILLILVAEYLSLGCLAALTGIVLATAASWALATFVFKIQFTFSVLPLVGAVLLVSGLTLLTGLLTTRSVCNHPPLEILRNEV